jgi:diguanylate cyclase (GGDEF)-like protein/PAS domain S-box-containing protein
VASFAALAIVLPLLYMAWQAFEHAQSNRNLVDAIQLNFFERVSLRDQYFLYREDRTRALWDENKAQSDTMLVVVKAQLRSESDQLLVKRVRVAIDDTVAIFHRIVDNTQAMQSAKGNRAVYEELDKRLYSQLLLRATEVRNAIHALQDASTRQVERAYRRLAMVTLVLALALAAVIVFNAVHIGGLIRRRLAVLHQGTKRVADGDLVHRIANQGNDEFSELAQSVDSMTDKLQQLTLGLEDTVRARTAELQQSESHLRAIIAAEPECIKIVDAQGLLTQMNPAGLAMIEADSLEQVRGRDVKALLAPEYREAFAAMHQRVLAGESLQMEFEVLGLKGGRRWMETHAAPMWDHGQLAQLAVTRDISERKGAQAKLLLAASVFGHAGEGIIITDAKGTIVDINDAFTRITGYSREDAIGQNPRILSSGRQDQGFYAAMWNALIEQGHWSGEIWNRRKNGEVYAELITISAVRDGQGSTQHYVALFSDITAIKAHQSQLEHIAHFDALTNLPNRVLLADRLQQAMAQAQRRQQLVAVVFLDLDGFKDVNDLHGHESGDQVLITLAQRMKEALREGDTLARIGGDEFVAVLIDLEDPSASVPLLNRLLMAAALPVPVGDLTLQVSASLGVTFYPQAQDVEADQLLRQADQAMYQAKLAGKNRYWVFDAAQDDSLRSHHESLERIRLALENNEFVLHYQPKVNMHTGQVVGAEALIRWQHPENGLLTPAAFLPVIEDHPLAVDVGDWVINTALSQMELWHAAGLDLPVSVNIGARQLQQANFVDRLQAILANHPLVSPTSLELEVLETSALADMAQVSQVIEACAQIGVKFALDDFGTGYSSLTYLKRLRVALLKIDQSFVRDMLDDPDDMAILQGVIGLAAAFKREVIAEGVETVAHGTALLHLGCELAQGYGIARPMPPEQMPAWAATWQPYAAWCELPWFGEKQDPEW